MQGHIDFSRLQKDSNNSSYARQLREGYASLRFVPSLEKEFREHYLDQNVTRGRISAFIALLLVLSLISIDAVLGPASGSLTGAGRDAASFSRLGIIAPVLIINLLATAHPLLKRHYHAIAAVSVIAIGIGATVVSVQASVNGVSYIFSALILVMVYNYLFMGLLFNTAVAVSIVLFGTFAATAVAMGVPESELFYKLAMLLTAGVVGALGNYTLEHAVRSSFLEARLLNQLAERDGLTGLYNRRMFDDYIERLWRQARREGAVLEIIFTDIDDFKIFNDLYGHQAGDDCLKQVAGAIANCANRPFDFCARYGGEEIVLVLYDPPRDYAEWLPKRIRRDVVALGIPHRGSEAADVVSVSVGVAIAVPGRGRSLAGAVQLADEALYEAKEGGKNRVVFKDAAYAPITTGSFRVHGEEGSSAA